MELLLKRKTVAPLNPNKVIKPWGRVEAAAGVLGYTLHLTVLSRTAFSAVRFYFLNNAASAITGVKAACAVSTNNTSACVPTGAWNNITVAGSSSFTIPAAAANGGTASATASYVASDIITLPSVARTDGSGFILMVREYTPSAGNTTANRANGCDDYSTTTLDSSGLQGGAWNGDGIASPGSFARTITGLGAPVFVELFTGLNAQSSPVLLVCGDSTNQGQNADLLNYQMGAGRMAANALGIDLMSATYSGATSNSYVPNGITFMGIARPKVAAICPWSPNDADAFTAGVETRIIAQVAQWVAACYTNGCVPVMVTPTPKNGITSGQETARRTVVTSIKTFCAAHGIPVIDRDAIYTDYTSATGGYKTGLNSDTLHPNLAGYTAEYVLWLPIIQAALSA